MLQEHKKTIFHAALIVGVSVLLSRVLGLVREQYALYLFGAGWDLDSYVSASRIPNMLRSLLAEGGLTAVFVSIFSHLYSRNRKKAQVFFNQIVSYSIIFNIVLLTGLFLLIPYYVVLIHHSDNGLALVGGLSRILLPSVGFISVSSIFLGVLNTQKNFFIPAIAPLFGNIINIFAIYLTHKHVGIYSLAIGFFANIIFVLLIQIFFVMRSGIQFSLNLKITPRIKFFLISLLPVAFGNSFFQFNQVIANGFSSQIEGGNSEISRSFLLIQTFISILITGISVAILPTIASARSKNLQSSVFFDGLKGIILITFPFSILVGIFGLELARFVYYDILVFLHLGTGKITLESIQKIGLITQFFSPAIVLYSIITVSNNLFQGLRKYKYPIFISAVSTIFNLFLMHQLFLRWGLVAIPISLVISAGMALIIAFYLIKKKLKLSTSPSMKIFYMKNIFAGIIMATFMLKLSHLIVISPFVLILMMLLGFVSYIVILFILREKSVLHLFGHFLELFLNRLKKH